MIAELNDFSDNNTSGNTPEYVLCLYVTGASPNSIRAVENIKAICEKYLAGRYQLNIIDVHQQPELTAGENIIALPLLIKKAPDTTRRMIGDMSDTGKVLKGLGLEGRAT